MSRQFRSVFGGLRGASERTEEPSQGGTQGSSPDAQSSVRPLMLLGKSLVFRGEMFADEDMLLLGRLIGSLEHTGSVTIGAGGSVQGDIRARLITIKGAVEGDLFATEAIVLTPSAVVTGDIAAPRITIVEGGKLNGSVEMPPAQPAAAADAPPAVTPGGVLEEAAVEAMLAKTGPI